MKKCWPLTTYLSFKATLFPPPKGAFTSPAQPSLGASLPFASLLVACCSLKPDGTQTKSFGKTCLRLRSKVSLGGEGMAETTAKEALVTRFQHQVFLLTS